MKCLIVLSIFCFAIAYCEEKDFEPQVEHLQLLANFLPFDVDEKPDYEAILKSMTREQKNEIKKLLDLLERKVKDQAGGTS